MYTLYVENSNAEILYLTESEKYKVTSIEGLNPPKAVITSSVAAGFDGEKLKSSRLEKRNILITIIPEYPYEVNRIKLYNFFKSKESIRLFYKNQIRDVYIDGTVEDCEINPFSQKQEFQISIICPDPYFKDVEETICIFDNKIPLFEFPCTFPKEGVTFSEYRKEEIKRIANKGEVTNGLKIECIFNDGAENITIFNHKTNSFICVNAYFEKDDILTISTYKMSKLITLERKGKLINFINNMRKDSEWLEVHPGDNVFSYKCKSGGSNVKITIKTNNLYMGV